MWAILSCAVRSPGVLEVLHSIPDGCDVLAQAVQTAVGGPASLGSRHQSVHADEGRLEEVQSLTDWRGRGAGILVVAGVVQVQVQMLLSRSASAEQTERWASPVLPCLLQCSALRSPAADPPGRAPPELHLLLAPHHTTPAVDTCTTNHSACRQRSKHPHSFSSSCLPSCPSRPFSPSRSLVHIRLVCYSLNHTLSAYSSPSRYSRISDSTSACLLTSRAANLSRLAPPPPSPSPAAQPTTPTTATTRGTQHQQSVTG